jgi:hypothetical protein
MKRNTPNFIIAFKACQGLGDLIELCLHYGFMSRITYLFTGKLKGTCIQCTERTKDLNKKYPFNFPWTTKPITEIKKANKKVTKTKKVYDGNRLIHDIKTDCPDLIVELKVYQKTFKEIEKIKRKTRR